LFPGKAKGEERRGRGEGNNRERNRERIEKETVREKFFACLEASRFDVAVLGFVVCYFIFLELLLRVLES
jgi:hypothetical protein